MSNQNNNNVNGLNPELGDLVTFTSGSSSTTGRIIYRDETLIRIRPFHKRTHAVEFELDPTTHSFLQKYDVREIQIHEKRKFPHFSKQLGVSRGDLLGFYTIDGVKTGESKPVFEIIANEEYDGIQFDDGTTLDFGFIGPPEDIGVVVVLSAPVEPEDNSTYDAFNDAAIPNIPEDDISELIRSTALIREVPSEELVYDDSIQREDMFVSLLMDYDRSQQQNPRIMQKLYRETDLYLALKNSVREKTDGAALPTVRSYTASSLLEALEKQPGNAPIASVIPVADVKRIVYGDVEDNTKANVEIRDDLKSLGAVQTAVENFRTAAGADILLFADYMKRTLKSIQAYSATNLQEKIRVDQEVIRSAVPPQTVGGLPPLGDVETINADNITQIRPQVARLLSGNVVRDPKRDVQIIIADADSAKTVGHMLASPALSLRRAPNRSSVLIWDVLASNASRISTRLFVNEFATEVKQINDDAEFTLESLLQTRVTQSLSLSDRNVLTATDSFGLRYLEMTDELMKPLDDALMVGQQKWDTDYKKLIASAAAALREERGPAVASLGPIVELPDQPVHAVLQSIKERERTLHTLDLAVINELNKEAEATLIPIYYGMLAAAPEPIITQLKTIYEAESARQQRNTATKYEKSRMFSAEPTIINCPHVHDYELLMKVKDDQKRMILFDKFFTTYQAGEKGDYYVCGTCNTNLVCKHEVMMLNEFLSAGESMNTHKELLLKFAGPVFEGNYTCKNCGQKIKEIEYDSSMEFDDEGRPLIGRSVLETEETDEIESRMMSDKFQDLPFDEKDPNASAKLSLYKIARTVMEKIGYVATKEIYGRMISACMEYMDLKIPAKFKQEEKFQNAFGIGCMGALALMEFQVNNPDIPIAAYGCTFSRNGYPKDAGADTGALDYVACAITSIQINAKPWNNTSWTVFSDTKKRAESIKQIMKGCVGGVLGTIGGSLPTASRIYIDMLESAQRAEGSTQQRAKDKLPPAFRPLTEVNASMIERTPIGNAESFLKQVSEESVDKIGDYVYNRERQLIQEVIQDFHITSKIHGVIIPTSKRSESECCFSDLSSIQKSGFGVSGLQLSEGKQNELELQMRASAIVRSRDPAVVNAGTHIYVPWSAPLVSTELPQPEPASYYKLFLKHCFRGPHNGYVHEFDMNYVCRYCDFHISEELILSVDKPDTYKTIAVELVTSQVQISDEIFKELEQSVRSTKTIYAPVIPDVLPTIHILKELQLLNTMEETQSKLVDRLIAMNAQGAMSEQERNTAFAMFFGAFIKSAEDSFKAKLVLTRDSMNEASWNFLNKTNKIGNNVVSDNLLNIVKKLTGHRIYGPRNIVRNFVIAAEQLYRKYYDMNKISNNVMSRWFGGKYNKDHRRLLETSWEKQAVVIELLQGMLREFEDEYKNDVESVLSKFAEWMGPLTQQWMSHMYPTQELQEKELIVIYRWITLVALAELMNVNGAMYVGVPKNAERRERVKEFISVFIALSLDNAETNVYVFQKTKEQIREAINARTTKERAAIVKRIDDVDRGEREVELINKRLGLGVWGNVYTNKLTSSAFDMQLRQMKEFGVVDFDPSVAEQGRRPENAAEAYGLGSGRAEGADRVELAEYD